MKSYQRAAAIDIAKIVGALLGILALVFGWVVAMGALFGDSVVIVPITFGPMILWFLVIAYRSLSREHRYKERSS